MFHAGHIDEFGFVRLAFGLVNGSIGSTVYYPPGLAFAEIRFYSRIVGDVECIRAFRQECPLRVIFGQLPKAATELAVSACDKYHDGKQLSTSGHPDGI
jgi:hypothetical protein